MQRNKLQDGQKLATIRIRIRISYPVCHSITAQFRSGSNRQSQSSPFRAHGDNLFMEPPWTLNGLPHKSCGSTWYSIVNCRCLIIGLTAAAAAAAATSPTNMAAVAAKACSMHHFECNMLPPLGEFGNRNNFPCCCSICN